MNKNNIDSSVIELIELASIDSPYTTALVQQYRKRLVDRLQASNQIDSQTADYLRQ